MNRWIGAALALALAACVLAPPGLVFAEDAPQAAASEAVLDLDEHGEAGAEASITGTVRAHLVSATLPSSIAFTFDPAAEFDPTAGKNQVDTPSAAAAANHSVVPVVLEITQVQVPEPVVGNHPLNGSEQTLKLVARVDDAFEEDETGVLKRTAQGVGEAGTAILAVRPRGETFGTTAEFEQYALVTDGSITEQAPRRAATLPAESTVPLEVYGKFASDRFYGEYAVGVKVTFKIRALQSGESWDYLPSAN